MNLGRFFQRLALYRASRNVPLWVLVALAVGFYLLAGIGEAHAQTYVCGAGGGCNPQQAYSECMAQQAAYADPAVRPNLDPSTNRCETTANPATATSGKWQGKTNFDGSTNWSGGSERYWSVGCPVGTEWNDATKTCGDPPPTPEECLARTNLGSMSSTGSSGTTCSDGCTFEPDQVERIGVQIGTGPMIYTAPSWKATGGTCTAGPANEPTPLVNDQACLDAGNGMTMCLRADGMHCASASTGKQICWRPGETGTKTTDDVAQKRVPGTNPATPPTPPEGETFNQGPSTTTTTDKNGTTVTTTTTNFTTTGGTDAGGEDSGVPGDGSGGDGAGEGDDLADCEGCDTSDGSAGHEGDTIWGADETLEFAADEAGLGYGTTCPAVPDIGLLSSAGGLDWAGLCEVLQALGLIILAAAHMHALYILLEA